jgi:glucose-6-phosphate 1-dehydrogenase
VRSDSSQMISGQGGRRGPQGGRRPLPAVLHLPFEHAQGVVANRLSFGLDPESLVFELTGTGPGVAPPLELLSLRAELDPPELSAYRRILLDVLSGNSALSIRAGRERRRAGLVVSRRAA